MLKAIGRRVDAEFAEVLCADSAWVSAEFDAIVACPTSRAGTRGSPMGAATLASAFFRYRPEPSRLKLGEDAEKVRDTPAVR